MEKEISVNINLDGITGRVQIELQRATSLVAVGLQAAAEVDRFSGDISDGGLSFRYGSEEKWTRDQLESEWTRWILLNGFRDAAESVSRVLEEARTVLAFWNLEQMQKTQGSLSGVDWQKTIVEGGRKFHRLGLPNKIGALVRGYKLPVGEKLIADVLSINKARNCLVHRGGVVTELDCTSPNVLELSWLALVILFRSPNGEREVTIPAQTQEGESVAIASRPRRREFPLGAAIVVTTSEFAQICWTMFSFANELGQALGAHGKALGVKFSEKPGAA